MLTQWLGATDWSKSFNGLTQDCSNSSGLTITGNCTNWASRVRDVFVRFRWIQSVGDLRASISFANQRTKDQYLQQWHINLDSWRRVRTYWALRPNFTNQTYLQCIHSSEQIIGPFRNQHSPSQCRQSDMINHLCLMHNANVKFAIWKLKTSSISCLSAHCIMATVPNCCQNIIG